MKRSTTPRKPAQIQDAPPATPAMPEDVPTLQQQLRLCRAQNAYLHKELAQAQKLAPLGPTEGAEIEHLQMALTTLRERFGTLTLHYQQSQQDIVHLKWMLALARKALGWADEETAGLFEDGATQALDQCLKTLLVLAHPDRWSQGQPASDLAHAVASAINTMRERLTATRRND